MISQTKNRSKYIKTLIVDDDEYARKRLKRLLGAYENILIVGEAIDGLDAQKQIVNLKPDLVFMDIEMPYLSGIEVARSLGVVKPMVIFVTAFDVYAIAAFEVSATDYLLKPIQTGRLVSSLDKVFKLLEQGAPYPYEQYLTSSDSFRYGRKISFVDSKDIVVIDMDDVSLILTEDRYSQVFYKDKKLLIEEPLNQIINRLDRTVFLFAHRNAIVNINFVAELKRQGLRKYVLVMKNFSEKEVLVSRGCVDGLRKALVVD